MCLIKKLNLQNINSKSCCTYDNSFIDDIITKRNYLTHYSSDMKQDLALDDLEDPNKKLEILIEYFIYTELGLPIRRKERSNI